MISRISFRTACVYTAGTSSSTSSHGAAKSYAGSLKCISSITRNSFQVRRSLALPRRPSFIYAPQDVPLLSQNPLHLNTIPHSQIHAAIKSHLNNRTGSTVLEFTTLASNVPWMSREFILSAVPFLRRAGTPTPLLTSLLDVLKIDDARIKTVENVSRQYAALLITTAEFELTEERATRSEFINRFGMQMWREHRFLLIWEAALLNAGLTCRWIVVFET
ncbi:hypothetical protein CPB85DRAFT_553845 [Mucidula mucida]|nr:hypothetical protein CPB85DRAFT_553845 [Mucidula mucida]